MPDGFYLNLSFAAKGSGRTRIPAGSPLRPGDTRRPGGQFATAEQLTGVNRQIAQELQASVVANIQARILRPGASTNRLVRATAAKSNITVSGDRIGVGNEKWLNSRALYWRTIEEGSAAVWKRPFIGTQLYPQGPGKAPFPVARNQSPGLRTFSGDEKGWMDGERWVVKKEIEPMHAYADAFADFQPGRAAFDAVNRFLNQNRRLPLLFQSD